MKRTYYHVTPTRNAASIRTVGILSSFSRCANGAIFLVRPKKLLWAIRHVAKRHLLSSEDVTVFTVEVDADRTHKFHSGLWYTLDSIAPRQITHSYEVTEGR